jgi:S1-C subfamily serine protease
MKFNSVKNARIIPWIAGIAGIILMISVRSIAKDYNSPGGYLGVAVKSLDQDEKKEMGVTNGVLVVNVEKESPAEKAGLKENDIIMYLNDKKIRNPENLKRIVREIEPKSKGVLKIYRQGKQEVIDVTIGENKPKVFVWHQGDGFQPFGMMENRAFLGVKLQSLNADLAPYFGRNENSGALILEVIEDTPAQKAGLKSGDIIVSFDESPINTPDDVISVLKDFKPGDQAVCKVICRGIEKSVNVELDKPKFSSPMMQFSPVDSCCKMEHQFCVPDVDPEKIKEETDKMKDHMKDLEKNIQIKIKTMQESLFI